MSMQEIAQELMDNLQKELTSTQENVHVFKGALQGVQLLFAKLQEAESQDEQGNTAEDKSNDAAPEAAEVKASGRKK